jgi:hypothetical protein
LIGNTISFLCFLVWENKLAATAAKLNKLVDGENLEQERNADDDRLGYGKVYLHHAPLPLPRTYALSHVGKVIIFHYFRISTYVT